jgi:hypothetical protein
MLEAGDPCDEEQQVRHGVAAPNYANEEGKHHATRITKRRRVVLFTT